MAIEAQVLFGAIISAGGIVGSILSKVLEHPADRYEEKVKKLQKDRWSEVSTELGELMATVEDSLEEPDDEEGDTPPLDARYSLHIQNELNTDELDDLRHRLEAVDKPRELFKTCRRSRDKAFAAFLGAVVIGVASLLAYVSSPLPNGLSLGAFLIGFGVSFLGYATKRAVDFWQSRQRLDELWENYDFL